MLSTARSTLKEVTQELLHRSSDFLVKVADLDDATIHQCQVLAKNGVRAIARRALHSRSRRKEFDSRQGVDIQCASFRLSVFLGKVELDLLSVSMLILTSTNLKARVMAERAFSYVLDFLWFTRDLINLLIKDSHQISFLTDCE